MAYARRIIERFCQCGKRATVEVFGQRNERYGEFCGKCGARRVGELQKEEDAAPVQRGPLEVR